MPKITALPSMTSPDTADPAPVVDDSAGATKKMTLGQVRDWLYSLVNIPAGPASPVTRDSEHFYDHIASGLVITGDAYASTRNASMTAGVCYINGRRISISAVSARTYTASRDTYVDILDNADGTGTVVYTEVTNNAASPALAANSMRIGIVVTGASNIASVASINQGQENKVLPIASSIPYAVTDSLGNLICPRDPTRKLIGYRQAVANQNITTTTDITGLNLLCKPATDRKIKITAKIGGLDTNAGSGFRCIIQDVTNAVQIAEDVTFVSNNGYQTHVNPQAVKTPTAATMNYKVIGNVYGTGAAVDTNAGATTPIFLMVEHE